MRRRIPLFILAVVIAVCGARLAIVASSTEIGWRTIASQWKHALYGWTGLARQPVGSWPPAEQADFWLAQADRLTSEHPDSAAIHMGAAWMLDSPGIAFWRDTYVVDDGWHGFTPFSLEFDEDAIAKGKKEFRAMALDRCLELARRATELDPDDVRWWRMRARLLIEGDTLYSDAEFGPRAANWLEVLDECARHDPDNALYDYLAAHTLWNESATYEGTYAPDRPEDDSWLVVSNPQRFAEGEERFLAAQQKEYLAVGEAGYSAIAQVFARSRVPLNEQAELAADRLFAIRHATLYMQLVRWQLMRADVARQKKNPEDVLKIVRQSLRLHEQAAKTSEAGGLTPLEHYDKLWEYTYTSLYELADEQPSLVSPTEIAAARAQEERTRERAAVLRTVLRRRVGELEFVPITIVPSLIAGLGAVTTVYLLALSAAALVAGRILGSSAALKSTLGAWRYVLAWIVGCTGAIFVANLFMHRFESSVVSAKITDVSRWCLLLCAFVLALWATFAFRLRPMLRFLLLTTIISLATVVVIREELPRLVVPIEVDRLVWMLPLTRWFDRDGLLLGIGASTLSLTVASAWFMWRSARLGEQSCFAYWTRGARSRWGLVFIRLGQWAAVAAACWFVIYLAWAPGIVQRAGEVYDYRMRYARDPVAHYQEIIDEMRQVAVSSGSEAAAGHLDVAGASAAEAER